MALNEFFDFFKKGKVGNVMKIYFLSGCRMEKKLLIYVNILDF